MSIEVRADYLCSPQRIEYLTPRVYHVSDAFTQFRRFVCIKKTPLGARLIADTKKTRRPLRENAAQV